MAEAKMTKRRIPILTITLLACLLIAAGALVNSTAIDQSVFVSSGGSRSSDQVTLDSFLGQPVTGISAGGSTTLQAGFFTTGTTIEFGSAVYLPLVSR
jgi:hypothetical protein